MKTTMIVIIFLLAGFINFAQKPTVATVIIGTQEWTLQNLNFGTMIPLSQASTDNGIPEKYCYNNLESNCSVYGGLYDWKELMQYVTTEGAQGLCPIGFHVPSLSEWMTLRIYLGDSLVAGTALKQTGYSNWFDPWTSPYYSTAFKNAIHAANEGKNTSGFTAIGTGFAFGESSYQGIKIKTNGTVEQPREGYFHTSTKVDGDIGTYMRLGYMATTFYRYMLYPDEFVQYKFSARCIKDSVKK